MSESKQDLFLDASASILYGEPIEGAESLVVEVGGEGSLRVLKAAAWEASHNKLALNALRSSRVKEGLLGSTKKGSDTRAQTLWGLVSTLSRASRSQLAYYQVFSEASKGGASLPLYEKSLSRAKSFIDGNFDEEEASQVWLGFEAENKLEVALPEADSRIRSRLLEDPFSPLPKDLRGGKRDDLARSIYLKDLSSGGPPASSEEDLRSFKRALEGTKSRVLDTKVEEIKRSLKDSQVASELDKILNLDKAELPKQLEGFLGEYKDNLSSEVRGVLWDLVGDAQEQGSVADQGAQERTKALQEFISTWTRLVRAPSLPLSSVKAMKDLAPVALGGVSKQLKGLLRRWVIQALQDPNLADLVVDHDDGSLDEGEDESGKTSPPMMQIFNAMPSKSSAVFAPFLMLGLVRGSLTKPKALALFRKWNEDLAGSNLPLDRALIMASALPGTIPESLLRRTPRMRQKALLVSLLASLKVSPEDLSEVSAPISSSSFVFTMPTGHNVFLGSRPDSETGLKSISKVSKESTYGVEERKGVFEALLDKSLAGVVSESLGALVEQVQDEEKKSSARLAYDEDSVDVPALTPTMLKKLDRLASGEAIFPRVEGVFGPSKTFTSEMLVDGLSHTKELGSVVSHMAKKLQEFAKPGAQLWSEAVYEKLKKSGVSFAQTLLSIEKEHISRVEQVKGLGKPLSDQLFYVSAEALSSILAKGSMDAVRSSISKKASQSKTVLEKIPGDSDFKSMIFAEVEAQKDWASKAFEPLFDLVQEWKQSIRDLIPDQRATESNSKMSRSLGALSQFFTAEVAAVSSHQVSGTSARGKTAADLSELDSDWMAESYKNIAEALQAAIPEMDAMGIIEGGALDPEKALDYFSSQLNHLGVTVGSGEDEAFYNADSSDAPDEVKKALASAKSSKDKVLSYLERGVDSSKDILSYAVGKINPNATIDQKRKALQKIIQDNGGPQALGAVLGRTSVKSGTQPIDKALLDPARASAQDIEALELALSNGPGISDLHLLSRDGLEGLMAGSALLGASLSAVSSTLKKKMNQLVREELKREAGSILKIFKSRTRMEV